MNDQASGTALLSGEPDRLLATRAEAARILSLSVPEIDNLRRAGRLQAKRHGKKVLFPIAELERFVTDLPWEADLPQESN